MVTKVYIFLIYIAKHFLFRIISDQRNYNYNNEHLYDENITPPDPVPPNYEDDYYEDKDDYSQYPYTFNNYYYK